MKETTQEYIEKENATVRKPVELYRIWSGEASWYYTNSDAAVEFGGQTYLPATLSRGSLEYNSTLDVSTMKVQFAGIAEPVAHYIAQNPIDIVWVEIKRLFRGMEEPAAGVIFIGQIKTVPLKGLTAEAECTGFEHYLKMPVPIFRYQLTCNHKVFDARCALLKIDYKVSAVISLSANGIVLTAEEFDAYDAGYFAAGFVEYGSESRMIAAHSGNSVTLAYRMLHLENGETVDVYPGCNGRIETCRDKYDNIIHFLGFPFIPDENPALRVP